MMKKILWWYLCIQSSVAYGAASSFFMPRSVTHTAMYELALINYHVYHTDTIGAGFSWYISPFSLQSNKQHRFARYFLPNNACALNIQENGSGNIGSLWLNLIAEPGLSYSSTLCIAPQRKVAGAYFYLRFDTVSLFEDYCWLLKNIWASLSFAAMKVNHNLHMQETLTGNMAYGTIPGITTGIQAFNNADWQYGILSTCPLKKSGVDDLQIKLGDNWFFAQEQSHIGLYVVASIPTGNRPRAHYLFEPLVGSKHAAFGFGSNVDFELHATDRCTVHMMGDIKYRYLFSGCETRSFDLCANGSWSRYLLTVRSDATSVSLPGINDTSVPVKVTPGSQLELWFALHSQWCAWHAEVGYNLWYRSKDARVCFLKQFPQNTGIYDLAGAVDNNPISASAANISQAAIPPNQAPSDIVFTPSHGFNASSGSQLRALTNTVYGAFSYNGSIRDVPSMCGIGASYEFPRRFSALAQWSIWGTLGFRY